MKAICACGIGSVVLPRSEPLPAHAHGRVDADEQEKRPSEQRVDDGLVPYVGRDPALSPALGDKLEQAVDVWKGGFVCVSIFIDGRRAITWRGRFRDVFICGRFLYWRSRGVSVQSDALEAMFGDEVVRDGRLAGADSWVEVSGL